MTAPEIRPATDDQVRAWHDLAATGLMIVPTTIVDSLVARIEADRAERESNNRAFAEMNAVFSAVMRAVRGEALSEFDESHGAVHEANALRAAAQERDRKIAELEQERDDDTALIRRLNATVAARAEEIERLKAACRDIIHAHDLAFAHGQPLVFANGKHFDHTHFNGAAESARAALKPESPVR